MNRALKMLQPISSEMNQQFQEFKENMGRLMEQTDSASGKVQRFQRYIRTTLDEQKHQKEFEE